MTFINEGNPNYVDKLVNFEKMVRLNMSPNILENDSMVFKCSSHLPDIYYSPVILAAHDCEDSQNRSRLQKPALLYVTVITVHRP